MRRESSQCPQSFRGIYFFFQAEDGIRDLTVTGVQTCALPILIAEGGREVGLLAQRFFHPGCVLSPVVTGRPVGPQPVRSEERRVGKECTTLSAEEHVEKANASVIKEVQAGIEHDASTLVLDIY